jgi:hypothetical protein
MSNFKQLIRSSNTPVPCCALCKKSKDLSVKLCLWLQWFCTSVDVLQAYVCWLCCWVATLTGLSFTKRLCQQVYSFTSLTGHSFTKSCTFSRFSDWPIFKLSVHLLVLLQKEIASSIMCCIVTKSSFTWSSSSFWDEALANKTRWLQASNLTQEEWTEKETWNLSSFFKLILSHWLSKCSKG